MKTSKYFTSSGYIFVEGLTYICFADIGTARFSNLAKFAVTEKKASRCRWGQTLCCHRGLTSMGVCRD